MADQHDHKSEEMKGRTKEAAGSLTGDEDLKREGKVDQKSATVKDKVSDAADRVKDALTSDDDSRSR
ncbi:MAG: CsbD family protein [Actinobacteria bacterium]|nr:CsbD family protein [Actinomycetota bacterium]